MSLNVGTIYDRLIEAFEKNDPEIYHSSVVEFTPMPPECYVPALYLAVASASKNKETIRLLVENADIEVTIKTNNKQEVLRNLLQDSLNAIVERLMEPGFNGVIRDAGSRYTALHWAVYFGHKAMVSVLLRKGIAVDEKGGRYNCSRGDFLDFGVTAFYLAFQMKDQEMIKFLLGEFSGVGMLCLAIETDNLDFVKFALAQMVNLETSEEYQLTDIHYAVMEGSKEAVRFLVKWGSDINARDIGGKTPLFFAVEKGDIALVRCVLDEGADIKSLDNKQRAVIHHAVMKSGKEMIRSLVKWGSDINARDIEGKTPLFFAVERGDIALVRCVLDEGANFKPWGNERRTVIHHAKMTSSKEMVKFLVDCDIGIGAVGMKHGAIFGGIWIVALLAGALWLVLAGSLNIT